MDFPLRHISIRVPWHDAGWASLVCKAPELNGACVKLKRIATQKKDDCEVPLAGQSLDKLPVEQWPFCVEEHGAFMAPFELNTLKRHALAERDPDHYGHFRPTPQRYPAYSAGAVPFLWMMKENMTSYRDLLEIVSVGAVTDGEVNEVSEGRGSGPVWGKADGFCGMLGEKVF